MAECICVCFGFGDENPFALHAGRAPWSVFQDGSNPQLLQREATSYSTPFGSGRGGRVRCFPKAHPNHPSQPLPRKLRWHLLHNGTHTRREHRFGTRASGAHLGLSLHCARCSPPPGRTRPRPRPPACGPCGRDKRGRAQKENASSWHGTTGSRVGFTTCGLTVF